MYMYVCVSVRALTWWQVSRRAVHTKKPDMVWAVEVMRNMGLSGVTICGASGTQDMFGPPGAAADAGGAGAMPTGESFPTRSRGTSRLHIARI